jgi:hypothetical protein
MCYLVFTFHIEYICIRTCVDTWIINIQKHIWSLKYSLSVFVIAWLRQSCMGQYRAHTSLYVCTMLLPYNNCVTLNLHILDLRLSLPKWEPVTFGMWLTTTLMWTWLHMAWNLKNVLARRSYQSHTIHSSVQILVIAPAARPYKAPCSIKNYLRNRCKIVEPMDFSEQMTILSPLKWYRLLVLLCT